MLIVADDVDGDALQGLVVNRVKGVLKACAIKAPGFGESRLSLLEDLACVLGCKVYSDASNDNVEEIDIDDLGKCKKVIISRTGTVFVGGKGSKREIEERIEALRSVTLDITKDDDETMFIKERMARLSGGIAVLRVGGATEAELSERKDRVDDALNSTQAAIDEGILPGGGIALYRASRNICDTCFDPSLMIGVSVIKKACEAPFKQIVDNAGGVPEVILEKASSMKDSHGYDAATENFGDMFDMGIIDPLKVVRSALENASSAASMLLTVGCTLVSDE
jgi:chaperonin GroEL